MKDTIRILTSVIMLLSASSVQAQLSFDYLSERWTEYQLISSSDLKSLHRNHFNDTVTVEEMKEAFFKYNGKRPSQSPYEGFDSVVYVGGYGENVMLISPLVQHPQKKVRECRGVWAWMGNYKLLNLLDKNGMPQKQLLDKLNSDKEQKWLDGEVLKLGEPRWYMGFVVSPRPNWDIYDEGKLVARIGYSQYSDPDFFSYANLTKSVLDGDWYSCIDAGAKLLGALHGVQSSANLGKSEKTFSVLLYENPKSKATPYTLELLEPSNPDKETAELFRNFKRFVERIPAKAFKPYYTTDFRIMNGRYYRVTVNKCGWLVEDYFSISK